jgi:uncharacterized repeat protein (TIGR03806 family)
VRAALLVAVAGGLLGGCGKPGVVVHPAGAPPERLSDWGVVVADGGFLEIHDDAHPYVLNTPLFSDYALKLRAVWIPPGKAIEWRNEGPLEFPVGTIISKTFYYQDGAESDGIPSVVRIASGDDGLPARRLDLDRYRVLETRLLVRYADGWTALPYVWDEGESDARLSVIGGLRELRFDDTAAQPFNYLVPDVNQCAGCHVTDHGTKALQPIGPEAWQLNRKLDTDGGQVNQLDAWIAAGLLTGAPAVYPAGVDWSAASVPLADRARAYIDSNCAHCHNHKGAADTSALDLRLEAPPGRASGVCKPPVAVGRGSGDRPYDIYPGRPDASILVYRMQHTDPAIAMPEVGRSTVHEEAVSLIAEWIAGMSGSC